MTDIQLPSLADAMEEGTVLTWLAAAGQHVEQGDELVEIETDKATMTYESPASGVLEIVAEAGTTLPVGSLIARLAPISAGEESEVAADQPPGHLESNGSPSLDDPGIAAAPAVSAAARAVTDSDPSIRATPLARRLADAHGVDLLNLNGSGPRGRVRRADVERAAGLETSAPPRVGREAREPDRPAESLTALPEGLPAKGGVEVVRLTRLQQVIARRMSEAKATIPEFQVEAEVAFDAAVALRAELKEQVKERAPSFNDLIIKACALALRDHPRANGSYRDGSFELHQRINIGMAVAAEDALVVPTIFDADSRSVGSIASESRRLAARVRAGDATPSELAGATFTVSNLGMYGMSAITPVINPPQAAILGVGAMRTLPAVVDGALTERHVLTLRLSCDHRILYGADAAQFLAAVREYLERPLNLVL